MVQTRTLAPQIIEQLAVRLSCQPEQVEAADRLLADGKTIPFITRYCRDITEGLGFAQLEDVAAQRRQLTMVCERRASVREELSQQGLLIPELDAELEQANAMSEIDDIVLPFTLSRDKRAKKAIELGLEPLADALVQSAGTTKAPVSLARKFIAPDAGVPDTSTALKGARDVLAWRFSSSRENRNHLRQTFSDSAVLRVTVQGGREKDAKPFREFFDYSSQAMEIDPSRLLLIFEGQQAGLLLTELVLDDASEVKSLAAAMGVPMGTPCGVEIATAVADSYVRLLRPAIAGELMQDLRSKAQEHVTDAMKANLQALLFQPALGRAPVLGVNPGARAAYVCAAVSADGTLEELLSLDHAPSPDTSAQEVALVTALTKHKIKHIGVGNGSGHTEVTRRLRDVLAAAKLEGVRISPVIENGAAVYSTSRYARQELPTCEVSQRFAVTIARRLQDPLAELVKIDPCQLTLGQHQEALDQASLSEALSMTTYSAVNRVGVDVNLASPLLLQHVSGVSQELAHNIVTSRDADGSYASREELASRLGLDGQTFEASAGFMRIHNGDSPLDATAIHPAHYWIVEAMAAHSGCSSADLVGARARLDRIRLDEYEDQRRHIGPATLSLIMQELKNPGRDPRPAFRHIQRRDDLEKVEDLKPGMQLEGMVSNVTSFGAFVDIGVDKHGLVHSSTLSLRHPEELHDILRIGEIVPVKVNGLDTARRRISLKLCRREHPPRQRPQPRRSRDRHPAPNRVPKAAASNRHVGAGARHATIEDLIAKFGGSKRSK